MANKRAKFKPVKLMIGRHGVGYSYRIGTEKAKEEPRSRSQFWGFRTGQLASFCSRDFHRIFPHLKIKVGQGPFLIEVSAKLLKIPKKKAKKRV